MNTAGTLPVRCGAIRMTQARRRGVRALSLAGALLAAILAPQPAGAENTENPIAVFSGLDKITAKIISFEVPIGRTALFGTHEITPKVCFTRPPTEPPQTTAFVQVNERRHEGGAVRLFSGWMFAASPGLHAVEHPVYDVWLADCRTTSASSSKPSE